jgi:bifunctional non-homologous end joining protein LigD
MRSLRSYRAKRDFDRTREPRGSGRPGKGRRYVVQKHAARRLHYDLRLEHGGVMLSWAVTKGPSLVPGDRRLAVHVEDHPIEYNRFEGRIPAGEYGAGTVMVWDRGKWHPAGDVDAALRKGHLDFTLAGGKLKGRWHLVRMRGRPGERQEPWLLIKAEDEFARARADPDILAQKPRSAVSGRSMEEIAAGKPRIRPGDARAAAARRASSRVAAKAGRRPHRRKRRTRRS